MTTHAPKPQQTTLIPVTTMEEVPVLSAYEHAKLVASLREAESEIAAGRGAPYDSGEMRRYFLAGYNRRKQMPHA